MITFFWSSHILLSDDDDTVSASEAASVIWSHMITFLLKSNSDAVVVSAGEAAANKALVKKEKQLRFLIRKACKVIIVVIIIVIIILINLSLKSIVILEIPFLFRLPPGSGLWSCWSSSTPAPSLLNTTTNQTGSQSFFVRLDVGDDGDDDDDENDDDDDVEHTRLAHSLLNSVPSIFTILISWPAGRDIWLDQVYNIATTFGQFWTTAWPLLLGDNLPTTLYWRTHTHQERGLTTNKNHIAGTNTFPNKIKESFQLRRNWPSVSHLSLLDFHITTTI